MKSCPATSLCSAYTSSDERSLNTGVILFITKAFLLDQGPTVFGRTSACDVEKSLETDIRSPPTLAVFLILFYLETDLTREMHKKITGDK